MLAKKTRVLIVDDSALIRGVLSAILQEAPDMEVVGEAADPYVARDLIKKLNPDVLTLDVEMPRMDGLTFLGNLMRLRPMPVVMFSSLTEAGADVTLEALEIGAVDFLAKPKLDGARGFAAVAEEIVAKVRMAAKARLRHPAPGDKKPQVAARPPMSTARQFPENGQIIAIGASTGGTEAIRDVLVEFPANAPPTVIAQHIPSGYSAAFAQRLDKSCAIRVQQAEDGQRIEAGNAYVAPGGLHLTVKRNGSQWTCRLRDTEPVNRHKPSVDVLFESVSKGAGGNALAVLLTGMGADGAQAMKLLHDEGAFTVAQDEASSVVWGMPGAAVKLGAATEVLPLGKIADRVLREAASSS